MAKAGGIHKKSVSRKNSGKPYSQRACQKPRTQFFKIEVLLTFAKNVCRSIDVGVDECPPDMVSLTLTDASQSTTALTS